MIGPAKILCNSYPDKLLYISRFIEWVSAIEGNFFLMKLSGLALNTYTVSSSLFTNGSYFSNGLVTNKLSLASGNCNLGG